MCIRRRKRPPDAAIMRASQLDAARLDTELAAMLREQFMKIFSFFQPRLISAFQPELTLILELLVGSHVSGLPCHGQIKAARTLLQQSSASLADSTGLLCTDFQIFSVGRKAYSRQRLNESAIQG